MGTYKENKSAKLGETIVCPICGTKFVKKQYSHVFCSKACKDKYHNMMDGDRHKSFTPKIEVAKSIWHRFEAKTIPQSVEVIAYNKKWIDPDFNPKGIRIGFMADNGFISAYWCDYDGYYMTISKNIIDSSDEKDFYRNHIDNTEPEYWTEIPEFKIK